MEEKPEEVVVIPHGSKGVEKGLCSILFTLDSSRLVLALEVASEGENDAVVVVADEDSPMRLFDFLWRRVFSAGNTGKDATTGVDGVETISPQSSSSSKAL